jgi:predicted metal-dependent HD superfamily phosphohydrolase
MSDLLPLPSEQQAALETAYATPMRAYHHFGHALEVLGHVERVQREVGWQHPDEVRLAALYHDAVYDPARKDNEARSADLAREHLARWMPARLDADRVAELILFTARHGQFRPGELDPEAELFLDCDMAILGAAPEAFDAYHRGIAAEYRGHVPGWLFKVKRKQFLKALLGSERIYLSPYFHARLDTAARNNLRRAVTEKR